MHRYTVFQAYSQSKKERGGEKKESEGERKEREYRHVNSMSLLAKKLPQRPVDWRMVGSISDSIAAVQFSTPTESRAFFHNTITRLNLVRRELLTRIRKACDAVNSTYVFGLVINGDSMWKRFGVYRMYAEYLLDGTKVFPVSVYIYIYMPHNFLSQMDVITAMGAHGTTYFDGISVPLASVVLKNDAHRQSADAIKNEINQQIVAYVQFFNE